VLQCVAQVVQYVAHVLQCVAHVLQCVAHVLQCVAHVLQCVAHVLQCFAVEAGYTCCSVLQWKQVDEVWRREGMQHDVYFIASLHMSEFILYRV